MDLLLFGTLSLVVGTVLSLVLPGNRLRVAVNLLSQAVACYCILYEAIPTVLGGDSVTGVLVWSYPVGEIDLALMPIGAFFLMFAVPMTLLGSIYAVGYLQDDIAGSDHHVGTHFALLSLVQLSYRDCLYGSKRAGVSGRLGVRCLGSMVACDLVSP